MKKKILYGFAVLTIAVVVAINMNVNSNRYSLSDLSLANAEALASNEGDINRADCYPEISQGGTGKVKWCSYSCGTYINGSATSSSTCN